MTIETQSKTEPHEIERKTLVVSKWANLFMGSCGILAAWLSNSEAILLDGLFSGIGFISAMLAVRVGQSVTQPPDRRRPFGYDADEALYTTFRALSLIGLILFAAISAIKRIVTYSFGGDMPELVFGPIKIYFLIICITCLALAFLHHVNWKRTGRKSEILKLEMHAAFVDGAITAGAGVGLLAIPFLAGTPLAWIAPIGDSIVLLLLCAAITAHPVYSFRRGLAELAGVSVGPAAIKTMRRIVRDTTAGMDVHLVDLSVNKIGRNFTAVVYIDPVNAVTADQVDQLALTLEAAALDALGRTRVYVLVSKHGRSWNMKNRQTLGQTS